MDNSRCPSSGCQSGSLRGQEDPSPVPPQCTASVPASAVVKNAVKSRRTKGGKSVNSPPSSAAQTWQFAATAIVIIAFFVFVFFAAVVVVVGSTPTRSAPWHVSSLLVLPNCRQYIFDRQMISLPPPAHPRQTDFSFMSLPPLHPPAIPFPSLPLRHLPAPLFPDVSFPIPSVINHHHLLFVCGVFFVIIVVKTPHQFLLMGGWAPLHSPHCLPPLRTPSLLAPPFLATSKWHTIIC
jgi:hypothetical protein